MNPILQVALIVVVGVPICALGTLGMLLLCMRVQTALGVEESDQAQSHMTATGKDRDSVVFEVNGKRVALRIDAGDAHVSGLRIGR